MKDLIISIAVFLTIIFILLSVLMFIAERVNFVSYEASIEQLREDSKKIDVRTSEDVIGQITETNKLIKVKQRWNKSIVGFFIPDGWDDIELIEIPTMETLK